MKHTPGIYFDLPEEEYHAIEAFSSSGIKNILISPMDFWANSWLNPNPPKRKEKLCFLEGSAYHARILEGKEAFNERYIAAPVIEDYPDALKTTEDIKEELRKLKNDGAEGVKLTGKKEELIKMLLSINPEIQIFDELVKQYARANIGRKFIDRELMAQIELASSMIEKHPSLSKCFQGGYAEVTILWVDEVYQIPMKARIDFLKLKAIIDLKTFANINAKPIDRAIYGDIAARKYHIQAAVYFKAVQAAKRFAKKGMVYGSHDEKWVDRFASAQDPQFVFVFQQKGIAPLARGKIMPMKSGVIECANEAIRDAMESYVKNMEMFGYSPWVDISEIERLDDEGFPIWISEA